MTAVSWWIIALAVLVGHGGMHIGIYNRINGFGFPRKVVKSIVKFFLLTTVAIPSALLWMEHETIFRLLTDGGEMTQLSSWLFGYGCVCLLAWLVLGVPWLMWRP